VPAERAQHRERLEGPLVPLPVAIAAHGLLPRWLFSSASRRGVQPVG
jgi:hypothetical protein